MTINGDRSNVSYPYILNVDGAAKRNPCIYIMSSVFCTFTESFIFAFSYFMGIEGTNNECEARGLCLLDGKHTPYIQKI